MKACQDIERLYELGGLIDAITDETQRKDVESVFEIRIKELEQP